MIYHKNKYHSYALSDYGKIQKSTTKSDFLKCFFIRERPISGPQAIKCWCSSYVAVMIQISHKKLVSTYAEYAKTEIEVKVYSKLNSVQNLFIIFNVYYSGSPEKVIFEGKHHYWQKFTKSWKCMTIRPNWLIWWPTSCLTSWPTTENLDIMLLYCLIMKLTWNTCRHVGSWWNLPACHRTITISV